MKIHADYIKPKDLGGQTTIENGQTLCAAHSFRKKNFKQTEAGKNMFIRLYELSEFVGDHEMRDFCRDILQVFEKHNVKN